MTKQFSAFMFASILFLFASHELQLIMGYLEHGYDRLSDALSYVFNTNPVGNTLQEALCLVILPTVIVGIPAGIYWVFKRTLLPYFYHATWAVWIVLFTDLIMHQ